MILSLIEKMIDISEIIKIYEPGLTSNVQTKIKYSLRHNSIKNWNNINWVYFLNILVKY